MSVCWSVYKKCGPYHFSTFFVILLWDPKRRTKFQYEVANMEVDSPEPGDGELASSEVEQTAQSAGFDRRPDLTNQVVYPTGRRDDAGNCCARAR